MIDTLIDKTDTFEQVRNQIAAILVTESASQQALAVTAGKDSALWKLNVYVERSNPWQKWESDPDSEDFDTTPIVNVWYENSTFDMAASNAFERQRADGIFNIDVYGYGISTETLTGHTSGDENSAMETQRAVRLVRNILMAAEYGYLGMRGVVGERWPQSVTVFQPQMSTQQAQQIVGARIVMRVKFNEFSPQVTPVALEYLSATVKRTEDNQVVLLADFDYTL
jgi:hypothetical protein